MVDDVKFQAAQCGANCVGLRHIPLQPTPRHPPRPRRAPENEHLIPARSELTDKLAADVA